MHYAGRLPKWIDTCAPTQYVEIRISRAEVGLTSSNIVLAAAFATSQSVAGDELCRQTRAPMQTPAF